MKDLIKAYQKGTSNEVVEKILKYVESDLSKLKYSGDSPKVDDGLIYVAYRIKAFILKNTFNQRNARNVTENSHHAEDYKGFQEFKEAMYEADWIPLNFAEIERFNFQSIYEHEQEIREYFGYVAPDLFNLLETFEEMSIHSNQFKADYEAIRAELEPLFVEGLRYALTKVDIERTEKEIVKYINKAMLTKFIELQMKKYGFKRIRNGNESTYIKVETNIETDIWMLMFGKTLKRLGVHAFFLTPKQKEFVMAVYDIIEEDLKANNVDAFKWTKENKPVINKRYLAGRMGMEETNFKQTLNRCKEKIYSNWKQAMDNYYS